MKLEKECSYYKKKYADNNTIQSELEKWNREGTYKVFMELCLNLYLHTYSLCQVPDCTFVRGLIFCTQYASKFISLKKILMSRKIIVVTWNDMDLCACRISQRREELPA